MQTRHVNIMGDYQFMVNLACVVKRTEMCNVKNIMISPRKQISLSYVNVQAPWYG